MIGRAMAARKPSRYLAPIALLAVGAAIFLVVRSHVHTTSHASTGGQLPGTLVQSTRHTTTAHHHKHHAGAKTYTIKSGDTLSAIAAHTGVSVSVILRLNPGLNANALQTGQVIKLRR
jgi:LysM repeat protein